MQTWKSDLTTFLKIDFGGCARRHPTKSITHGHQYHLPFAARKQKSYKARVTSAVALSGSASGVVLLLVNTAIAKPSAGGDGFSGRANNAIPAQVFRPVGRAGVKGPATEHAHFSIEEEDGRTSLFA